MTGFPRVAPRGETSAAEPNVPPFILMRTPVRHLRLSLALLLPAALAAEDLIIADFEAADFGAWAVTGEAFGKGPAAGALPGQMEVSGFQGKGFVNSYHGGDDATGRMISPPFKIERRHLNFLIGGGGFPGKTCIHLIADGKVVRSATGPNRSPGGSERLAWESWDVSDLTGKSAAIEIIDDQKGSWGHLNVDQLVQSDTPAVLSVDRRFTVDQRYLIWPVTLDTRQKRRFFLTLDVADQPLAYLDICLSNNPDFWVFTDLANFQGRTLTVTGKIPGELAPAWEEVVPSETYPGEDQLYKEPLRP